MTVVRRTVDPDGCIDRVGCWLRTASQGTTGGHHEVDVHSPHGAQRQRGGRKPPVRTIAITGSASGIGAATRAQLEASGHRIIGVDLEGADVNADLADPDHRARAVDEVLDACGGRLDGLVTSAGVGPPFDPATMLTINWFGTEAFLTGLRDALAASEGIAKVVAVSSNSTTITPNLPADLVEACLALDHQRARDLLAEAGVLAMPVAYACSKLAVARYVRRHAPNDDWAGAGIRLNAIAPGATLTPLLQSGLDDELYGELIRGFAVPTGGFGTPAQIADWIVMMLSDSADFLCGSIIFVDGGSDAMVRPDAWPAVFEIDLG